MTEPKARATARDDEPEQEQPRAEAPRRLDEAPRGGVYIVNGQRVDADGKELKGEA